MSSRTVLSFSIEHLGALGDGVGMVDGKKIHVPYTMPGDVVEMVTDKEFRIIQPSPERQAPACPHFMRCGGCSLQHLPPADYARYKQERLQQALTRAGFDHPELPPMIAIPPFSRRRAEFHRDVNGQIGFYAARSREVIPITHCAVLRPNIMAALHYCQQSLPLAVSRLSITDIDGKIDIVLYSKSPLQPAHEKALTDWAAAGAIARVSMALHDEPPTILWDHMASSLAPGSFLQATEEGEKAIDGEVMRAIRSAHDDRKIVEFYAGLGQRAQMLAQSGHQVTAYEGDARMVAALRANLPTAYQRDLYKNPVKAAQLQDTDIAIINPPYNGAEPQTREMGKARIPTIILISCNPITLERDLKPLHQAGYSIERATVIDQFVWTTHLESVVVCRL